MQIFDFNINVKITYFRQIGCLPPSARHEDRRNEKGRKIEREKQIINYKIIEREIVKIIIMK